MDEERNPRDSVNVRTAICKVIPGLESITAIKQEEEYALVEFLGGICYHSISYCSKKINLPTGAAGNKDILSTTGWINELHHLYPEMYAL